MTGTFRLPTHLAPEDVAKKLLDKLPDGVVPRRGMDEDD